MAKKFILNADDFGMSDAFNEAVLKGYEAGLLTSASLCANGEAFQNAIENILPKCKNMVIMEEIAWILQNILSLIS